MKQEKKLRRTLKNACPVKITLSDVSAGSHEIAIKVMELVHDGFI